MKSYFTNTDYPDGSVSQLKKLLAFVRLVPNCTSVRRAKKDQGYIERQKASLYRKLGNRQILKIFVLTAILLLSSQAEVWSQASYSRSNVSYIVRKFQQNHLSRKPYDNKLASTTLEQYLIILDSERNYFLGSDIKEFKRRVPQLSRDLPRGRVKLAYTVYQRFKKRLLERNVFIEKILKKPLALPASELIWLDRSEADWPSNRLEAERIWRAKLYSEQLEETSLGKSASEALATLKRRYHSVLLRNQQLKESDIASRFLNAFASSYDPHSAYLNHDDLDNFNIAMRLSLEGIGATLRWEDGQTFVNSLVPGGAAARHKGLQPADRIVAVAQGKNGKMEDITHLPLLDVVKLIRGKRGTIVRLRLIREVKKFNKSLEISIRRDKIELTESEAKSSFHQLESSKGSSNSTVKIGVVVLPSFYQDFEQKKVGNSEYKSSTQDVKKILAEFIAKSVDAVVLDLRGNSGGSLDEAISMSNLFIPKSVIVKVRYTGSVSDYDGEQTKAFYQGPLIVMVDRFSASASEIVAGALQDYGRAVIVGDSSTFGKGTVQNIITLRKKLGALRTTVAQFYRPSHASTQKKGVVPGIIFSSINSHLKIGEADLKNALPWDALPEKPNLGANNIAPLVAKLKARSDKRRRTNPHFKKIKQDIDDYLVNSKDKKTISVSKLEAKYEKNQSRISERRSGNKNKDSKNKDSKKDDFILLEAFAIIKDYLRLIGK